MIWYENWTLGCYPATSDLEIISIVPSCTHLSSGALSLRALGGFQFINVWQLASPRLERGLDDCSIASDSLYFLSFLVSKFSLTNC